MLEKDLPLLHALIEAFLFLESSSDDELDQDSAVRCMENMASSILHLTVSDQIALRSQLTNIADETTDNHAYSAFVRALPDMIGLSRH